MASPVERWAHDAMTQLHVRGVAKGPTIEVEQWRRRVRSLAAKEGLRIRTGVGNRGGGWAMTVTEMGRQVAPEELAEAGRQLTEALLGPHLRVVE